jgi:two-component system, sensor histidine kinase and response regulator
VSRPPKILVVDDQPVNITLMQKKLEREGMTVQGARSGAECLRMVGAEKPDLILLDVMMPEMDGMEVCAALKANEETRPIPVIFLTAKSDRHGMLAGLAAGAVDYLTKPVDLDEAAARVRAQLRCAEIFQQNLELTRRLSEARRAAALGALSQGIAHNLNNLLGVIYGYVELAKVHVQKPDVVGRHLDKIEEAVGRMTKIIRQVTSVSTRTQLSLSLLPVPKLVEGAIERFRADQGAGFVIEVANGAGDATIMANVEVFEDAMGKLLKNACESYGLTPPPGASVLVEIDTCQREGRPVIEITVHDRGNGIDPEVRDHVFEPFVSTKSTVGVGMGLTTARHSIRNLGGEITLRDRPGGGTSASFFLPLAQPAAASAA